jgi:hypothetical protein
MASLRTRSRKDGSTYYAVLYRSGGKQTSTSFEDLGTAQKFQGLVDHVGPLKALGSVGADPALSTMTVEQWVHHHIEHRTGLAKSTLADYRSYLKHDIAPSLGPIPLKALTREDVAKWMQAMSDAGKSDAIQPTDIDRDAGTVRINWSWKHGAGGYTIGTPKTTRSRRTINVRAAILD